MSGIDVDMTSKAATGGAKSLAKGLGLVELIAADGPQRLTDLVEATGIPRPTMLRLLSVLVDHGILRTDTAGRYELGPGPVVWAQRFLDRLDVRHQAEDLMRQLTEHTRETCFLGVRRDDQVFYVAKSDTPQAVRPAAEVGDVNPMHSTGMGKILLAYADGATVRRYLRGPLGRRTPNTITEPESLAAELAATRDRGYAIDEIENEEGVRCVGAPVRDHSGQVVAALSVSAPAYRFPVEQVPTVARRVRNVAGVLSTRLGHRDADPTPTRTEDHQEVP